MKKLCVFSIICLFSMLLIGCQSVEPVETKKPTGVIEVVPTLDDEIKNDTTWCCTFQLVWNDMQDLVTVDGVHMNPQPEIVDLLNKQGFKEDMISEEYFYKKFGVASPELKEEIIKGLRQKFNQSSDILNQLDFTQPEDSDTIRYIFYTMLYREFEYKYKFDLLGKDSFKGSNPTDVDYFGINNKSDSKLYAQVIVNYYKDKDNFAITLVTKNNDQVVLIKNPNGNTFGNIWDNYQKDTSNSTTKEYFTKYDVFKMPKLSINVLKEYKELYSKKFPTKDGKVGEIEKALQTIKFDIDEKGGRIKSEAAIQMRKDSAVFVEELPEPRYFNLDDTFALFLKEEGKDMPYFGVVVDDITKY